MAEATAVEVPTGKKEKEKWDIDDIQLKPFIAFICHCWAAPFLGASKNAAYYTYIDGYLGQIPIQFFVLGFLDKL